MEGPQSPSEEVIILIDPDNWIVRDLGPIAAKVSRTQRERESMHSHIMLHHDRCTLTNRLEIDTLMSSIDLTRFLLAFFLKGS